MMNIGFKRSLVEKYPDLSPKEKKIADYLINSDHYVFTHSAVHVAEKTGTSPATVVRFAQHLGYTGYHQLKNRIVDQMKEQMMPEERFKLLKHNEKSIATVLKIAEQEVDNINQTINQMDKTGFDTFIDLLNTARLVYTLGTGMSSLLARLTAYLLSQSGLNAHYCGKDEHSFIERLINLSRRDVVIGFSLPPYSQDTVKAMKFCHEHHINCLAVTNALNAPVIEWSQASILVQTKNLMFTNSIAAVTVIINSLATEIALLNKRKLVPNIDLIYDLLKEEYVE